MCGVGDIDFSEYKKNIKKVTGEVAVKDNEPGRREKLKGDR